MGVSARPWGVAEQAHLLLALRSGHPPAGVCRSLDRSPDDVRRRLLLLLGDGPAFRPDDPTPALDVLWLRLHIDPVDPTLPTPQQVADLWQRASGIGLTPEQQRDLAADPYVPLLARAGRYALLSTGHRVYRAIGALVLEDWLDAVAALDPAGPHPLPASGDPGRAEALRTLLEATVEDISPRAPRRAVRRHLGLEASPHTAVDAYACAAGVVEMARAGGIAERPAARLRSAVGSPAGVEELSRALGVEAHLSQVTTLAVLAGYDQVEAQQVAGRVLSPWRRPPNLGRGVVVRTRLL